MRSDRTHAANNAIDQGALDVARASALDERLTDLVADSFRLMADPTRLRLVRGLGTGPMCVRDLALLARVSESATSHQLRRLRDRGLVATRRVGTVIYYSLSDHHLPALLREAEYHAGHRLRNLPDHAYPPSERPETAVGVSRMDEPA